MAGPKLEAFLTHLTNERSVVPSTHSQALSALLFFYSKVLRHDAIISTTIAPSQIE